MYSYTVHSLAGIVVGAPKYFSLGYKLLNSIYCNLLRLGGFYASLFYTAFLSLKGQFHKIFLPLLLCLQYFIWAYYGHAKTVMLTFSAK